jgi:hypothetical protein
MDSGTKKKGNQVLIGVRKTNVASHFHSFSCSLCGASITVIRDQLAQILLTIGFA